MLPNMMSTQDSITTSKMPKINPSESTNGQSDLTNDPDSVAITTANIGKVVTITGSIIDKYDHPDGHIFLTIRTTDGNEEIPIPIFKNLEYPSDNLTMNSTVSIKGKIDEYKGKLEVIPDKADDIVVISKSEAAAMEFKAIKDISTYDQGKLIKTSGIVSNVKNASGNTFFNMTDPTDNSKTIAAVIFKSGASDLNAEQTLINKAGDDHFAVQVIAKVNIYKDELELIIDKAYTD